LEGPSPSTLKTIVVQALPLLMELMGDASVPVQDTAAWTIGRVCDLVPEAIDPQQHLPNLVKVLLMGLQRDPRVASNCAWVRSLFLPFSSFFFLLFFFFLVFSREIIIFNNNKKTNKKQTIK
jgi:hypothetical protein